MCAHICVCGWVLSQAALLTQGSFVLAPFLPRHPWAVLIKLATVRDNRSYEPANATQPNTHTRTHTHVGFYGLRGLSIGVMFFILCKLYVLLPYTYPTPKLSPHRRQCISIFPQKNSLCMIYKPFKLWGHWKCPHKSPSPCNTYVIPMSLYKFVSS